MNSILSKFQRKLHLDKVIQKNEYNDLHLVRNDENDAYVLRISKRLPTSDVAFEISLLEYLDSHHLPVVRIIKDKNSAFKVLPRKNIATLFSYIKGKHIIPTIDKPVPEVYLIKAAAVLASLHNETEGLVLDFPRQRTLTSELDRVLQNRGKVIELFENGDLFVKDCNSAIAFINSTTDRQVILHNDYRPQNVFFNESGEVIGVIDFDWSCPGSAIKDLAHSLTEWSYPDGAAGFHLPSVRTFLDGYNNISLVKYKLDDNLKRWMWAAALSDAATYFMDKMDDNKNENRLKLTSYMYAKAKESLNL